MTDADDAVRRQVLAEWATFLRATMQELLRYAERKALHCGLGSGLGGDLVGELTATLYGMWERLAVIVDEEDRRKFTYRVLGNLLLRRLEKQRLLVTREVPLPAEDLLPADVRRVADVADQYTSGEAAGAYLEAMQALTGQERLVIDAMLDVEAGARPRTYREIAEQIGVPERQVGRLFDRAQATLLARMNAWGYDFSDLREGAR